MLEKLALAGLKLKPSNCEIFHTKLHYIGHVVSQRGIEADPKKIAAIVDWPISKTVIDVDSFLGLTNYYCTFIHDYA